MQNEFCLLFKWCTRPYSDDVAPPVLISLAGLCVLYDVRLTDVLRIPLIKRAVKRAIEPGGHYGQQVAAVAAAADALYSRLQAPVCKWNTLRTERAKFLAVDLACQLRKRSSKDVTCMSPSGLSC